MLQLKQRIRSSGLETYVDYPCEWGGVTDYNPVVAGLLPFGERVLNNLWNAIQLAYPDQVSHILYTVYRGSSIVSLAWYQS